MESKYLKDQKNDKNEDETEKKYDKIFKHIRLSNDPREREHSENFYAHRINELANNGKVILI